MQVYSWDSHFDIAPHWLADGDRMPRVIAHQGGNQERPVQSNLAFGHAHEIGVDVFELEPLEHFRSLGLNALNNSTSFRVFNLPVSFRVGPVTIDLTSRRLRRDIARRGMALHYWTINSDEQMVRLIELGVDGIITDRPSRLQEHIAERRTPSP